MPDYPLKEPVLDLARGIRQSRNPYVLPPGTLVYANRVDAQRPPVLGTGPGRTIVGGVGLGAPSFVAGIRLETGQYHLLRGLKSTGYIERYAGGTSWVSLGYMSATLDVYAALHQAFGYLILGDGVLMKKTDGQTFADLGGTPPLLTHLEIHQSRLWGVKDFVGLYCSGSNAPEIWDEVTEDAWHAIIDSPDGSPITAIKSAFGRLWIFTKTGLICQHGDGDWNWYHELVDVGSGAINHRCVAQVGNALYYLGKGEAPASAAVWEYYSGSKPRNISKGWLDDWFAASAVDWNLLSTACVGTRGVGDVRISLPGLINRDLVFDTTDRTWHQVESVRYLQYLYWGEP